MALRSDPSDVQARLQLAGALRASGRFEAVLDHYPQGATLEPRLAEVHFGYAMALVASSGTRSLTIGSSTR
jgi:cytochrome c-type biogenesis protein CcmH/NrfG